MNKKYFWVISISVVIVIGIILIWQLGWNKNNLPGVKLSNCNDIQNIDDRFNCYYDTAINNQDLSICDQLDPASLYSCYSEIAAAKKDLSICEKIEGEYNKSFCYIRVAVAKQDISICDTLAQDSKSFCYKDIAIAKEDLLICDTISDPTFKDSCYNQIGIAKQDSAICEKIKSAYYLTDCLEKITDEDFVNSCNISSITMEESWYDNLCKEKAKTIVLDTNTGLPKELINNSNFQVFLNNYKSINLTPFEVDYTDGYAGFYPLTQNRSEEKERYWKENGDPKLFISDETKEPFRPYYSPESRWVAQIFADSPDSYIELWDLENKCHSRPNQCGTLCDHEGFLWLDKYTFAVWGNSYENYNISTATYNKYVAVTQIFPEIGICQNGYLSQPISNK